MNVTDRLRQKLVDAGFDVSGRDDVSLAAFAWYAGKAVKTVRNTLHQGRWPRSELVGGNRRFKIEAIVRWEFDRIEKAA